MYGKNLVWKSSKAIYGLREAPLAWAKELAGFVLKAFRSVSTRNHYFARRLVMI